MFSSLVLCATLLDVTGSQVCLGGFAARHASRVSARHVTVSRSYSTPWVAVPQNPAPVPVAAAPGLVNPGLEARVAGLEQRNIEAGRHLSKAGQALSTIPAWATPPMASAPAVGVTYAAPVYGFREASPASRSRSRSVTRAFTGVGATPVRTTLGAILPGCGPFGYR